MNGYQEKLAGARRVRTEHVASWRSSGLSQAAYCAAHGINATTFNGWVAAGRNLRQSIATDATKTGASASESAPAAVQPLERTEGDAPSKLREIAVRTLTAVPVKLKGETLVSPSKQRTEITIKGAGGWCIELSTELSARWLGALLREIDCPDPTRGRADEREYAHQAGRTC